MWRYVTRFLLTGRKRFNDQNAARFMQDTCYSAMCKSTFHYKTCRLRQLLEFLHLFRRLQICNRIGIYIVLVWSRDSSVGKVSGLRTWKERGFVVQFPARARHLYRPKALHQHWGHPVATGVCFPGGKETDHWHPPIAETKNKWRFVFMAWIWTTLLWA
jgi:hypothetical protein